VARTRHLLFPALDAGSFVVGHKEFQMIAIPYRASLVREKVVCLFTLCLFKARDEKFNLLSREFALLTAPRGGAYAQP